MSYFNSLDAYIFTERRFASLLYINSKFSPEEFLAHSSLRQSYLWLNIDRARMGIPISLFETGMGESESKLGLESTRVTFC